MEHKWYSYKSYKTIQFMFFFLNYRSELVLINWIRRHTGIKVSILKKKDLPFTHISSIFSFKIPNMVNIIT